MADKNLPKEAQVVIIGGGVIGCSLAYHLAKAGCKEVILLERKQLTCGTTWHAAGLVGQLRATMNMTKLARYTANLYADLEAETGQGTGYKRNGSISLADNHERFEELRRGADMAQTFGLPVDVITPEQVKELWPLLNVEDIVGAVHLPDDGQTNPTDTAMALAKGARMNGAEIFEQTKVTGIIVRDGTAVGVQTENGDIMARHVVNCAGMWGREVGRMAGVTIPLHACEHFYVVTEVVPGLPPNLPVLRNQDSCAYFKEDAGKILLGAFEQNAKPWGMDGIPEDFCFDELPEDFDHFMPILEGAMHRLPILQNVGIRTFFNGPESFTPDDRYLLGPVPELENFYVAAGFNSIGIQSAGGAGKVLAEWIMRGHPPVDLWDVNIKRVVPFQDTQAYLQERVSESLGLLYQIHWPYYQNTTARNVRLSPLHFRLKEHGACFGEVAGWERPNWYAPEGVEPRYEYSYGRQNWFEYAREEHLATRENVTLFDQSSFAKFMVQGRDAERLLQKLSTNDVDVAPGRAVYTQWCNERGGIEADLTVTRLAEDSFMVITGAAVAVHDLSWMKQAIAPDDQVTVTDVTAGYAVIGVMGPNSRRLLQKVSPADFSNEAFPFGSFQEIELGYVKARALRISYVGELGWEIYVGSDYAMAALDCLLEAGKSMNLKLAGMHVLDSCRIEKAFRHWGHDITDEDTPIEAGLGFTCRFDKSVPFIGRDALLRQKEQAPLSKRMVQFLLEDPEPLLYHNEPIYRGDEIMGYVSSANYGHFLGGAVGMGYIRRDGGVTKDFIDDGGFEIKVAGVRYPARASLSPLYDPKAQRPKA